MLATSHRGFEPGEFVETFPRQSERDLLLVFVETEKHYAHLAPSHVAQLIRNNLPPMGGTPTKKARKVTRLRA